MKPHYFFFQDLLFFGFFRKESAHPPSGLQSNPKDKMQWTLPPPSSGSDSAVDLSGGLGGTPSVELMDGAWPLLDWR